MPRLVERVWMPVLLLLVVTIGGYAVLRIRSTVATDAVATVGAGNGDNTKPFNPKHITYEVTGFGTATLNYLDENGQPHGVDAASLPWSFTIVTTLPSMSANLVAQGDRATRRLRCRVVVDGQARDDRSTEEYEPFVYCLVKAV